GEPEQQDQHKPASPAEGRGRGTEGPPGSIHAAPVFFVEWVAKNASNRHARRDDSHLGRDRGRVGRVLRGPRGSARVGLVKIGPPYDPPPRAAPTGTGTPPRRGLQRPPRSNVG